MQNCLQHLCFSFSHEDQYTYVLNGNAKMQLWSFIRQYPQYKYGITRNKLFINLKKIMFYTLKNSKN